MILIISKKQKQKQKTNVYDKASELLHGIAINILWWILWSINAERKNIELKYDSDNLFLKTYSYNDWFENEESINKEESVDLSGIPPLEGDKEGKEGKGLKILTPSKLWTRFAKLLTQIKARNNSYKLKNEIRQILYYLYQHNKITKQVYNNLIKIL